MRSNKSGGRSLNSLTIEEASNLLCQIEEHNSTFEELITDGKLSDIFKIAQKLPKIKIFALINAANDFVKRNLKLNIEQMLFTIISSTNFIDEVLKGMICKFMMTRPTIKEIETILIFTVNCLKKSPLDFFEQMTLLYPTLSMVCEQFNEPTIRVIKDELKRSFDVAKNVFNSPKSNYKSQSSSKTEIPSGDYRSISVVPQNTDLFCLNEDVLLLPNRFTNANDDTINKYDSVDDYLNTQFRLLREDFIRPLRDSIAKIRLNLLDTSKLSLRDIAVRIYEKVIIEDLLPSRSGIVYKIKFDISKLPPRMDWKKARRFIHGSLLCFTNNLFNTMHLASVVESDPKHLCKGVLMVQFDQDPIEEILRNNEFMMLETKNLFEAYRHVLSKLQKFNLKTLPFQDYFVFAENVIETPAYLNKTDIARINILSANEDEMDESQITAFNNSLLSKISLVQGPPGTGKTYVGLKIIKYLSSNFQTEQRNIGPILVVCYTNHALDQFMEDIISVLGEENILRVGGRSKVECMKRCNITNARKKWIIKKRFPHNLYKKSIQTRIEMEKIEMEMVEKYIKFTNLNGPLLSYSDLGNSMNIQHRMYFQKMDFDHWLKGSEVMVKTNSKSKEFFINDTYHYVIMEYMLETVTELVEEACKGILDEQDNAEDDEAFLTDQRLLDEDIDLIKTTGKFQSLYNRNRFNEKTNYKQQTDEYFNEFKTVANAKLIRNKLKKVKPLEDENYSLLKNLDVDFDVRLRVYKYWFEKHRASLIDDYLQLKSKYESLSKTRQELSNKEYELIMKETKVIGMTTTGAARYGPILDQVGCKVVVIEEAAEVLEAHVICSLSEHCQHLIMIGDHKQLRPKVDVYDLEINYKLGISVFERLIANNCRFFTLQYQHRMRPEISKCVKPIYPDLKDSESVFQYLSVSGMNTDLYFFNHQKFEDNTNETSYKNNFEANFVTEFCRYLLKCGNLPSKITVLTFYTGQLYNISGRMKAPLFKGIRICVLDNYQGEENDIIILSLVRSNTLGKVGFLDSPNRLCVALSRAKRGFYVIGNMTMLCKKIENLADVIKHHIPRNNIGSKMPLQCSMHPNDDNFFITEIEDFSRLCPSICGMKLTCGHNCRSPCHLDKPSHKKYRCIMPCLKMCNRNQHRCKCLCWQDCKCEEEVEVTLHCGHNVHSLCYIEDDLVDCPEICEKPLECGHVCRKLCSDDCVCQEMIIFDLACGHPMEAICRSNIDELKCLVKVPRMFDCSHEVSSACWKKLNKCTYKVQISFPCGHEKKVNCCDKSQPFNCKRICESKLICSHSCQSRCNECMKGIFHKNCQRKCLKPMKCGHICRSVCHGGVCPPCQETCTIRCTHSIFNEKCHEICTKQLCLFNCTKRIVCRICKKSKLCQGICGEDCFQECGTCLKLDNFTRDTCVIYPCQCKINRSDYQPSVTILKNDLILKCQTCEKILSTPFKGLSLAKYNQIRIQLFRQLPPDEVQKWKELFDKISASNIVGADILDEILGKIKNYLIFNSDYSIFRVSFKFYGDLLEISSKIMKNSNNLRLEEFNEKCRQCLAFLVQWIDPTVRAFESSEIMMFNKETAILDFMLDIIQFVHSVTISEYALVFQKSFSLLEELTTSFGEINLEDLQKKFVEIKNDIGEINTCTNEVEALVQRINNSNDVLVEFQTNHLFKGEKLQGHRDENKTTDANAVFRKLNDLKNKLEA